MNHYEIVIILNFKNKKKLPIIINEYKNFILENKGKVHRIENWGYRKLAYKIKNIIQAYYLCLNIEINFQNLLNFESLLKFNNSVLRYLIIRKKKAEIKNSFVMKSIKIKKQIQEKNRQLKEKQKKMKEKQKKIREKYKKNKKKYIYKKNNNFKYKKKYFKKKFIYK